MTRRADPERIYLARRAALFGNLTLTRIIDELEAEHRIAAWEREAERQAIPRLTAAFWEAGERWIAERRTQEPKREATIVIGQREAPSLHLAGRSGSGACEKECAPLARAYPTHASGSRSS